MTALNFETSCFEPGAIYFHNMCFCAGKLQLGVDKVLEACGKHDRDRLSYEM